MASIVTYAELRSFAKQSLSEVRANFSAKRELKTERFNLFLSHSTKDDELLPGVMTVLVNHGGSVYIDDFDKSLPEKPSDETGRNLKNRIKEIGRLVLFATENNKESKWIPWELGLGDGLNGENAVAIFPSAEYSFQNAWLEQEYLGLYLRIVWGELDGHKGSLWMVLNAHKNTAVPLSRWIKGY